MIRPPQFPDMNVLVAETSEYQRRLIREALRSTGVRKVYEVGDGQSALDMVDRLVPDVMILDTSLQGMTGIDVLRQLSDKSDVSCPVILTVASPTLQFVEAAKRLGHRDILARPIRPSSLWQRLAHLLESGRIRPGHIGGLTATRSLRSQA